MGSTPAVKVLYNSEVYISKAFPNGYNPASPFTFTLTGVTNPITAQKTQPIIASVFYSEDTGVVDLY